MKKLIILVLLSGLGFQSFADIKDSDPNNILKTNLIADGFRIFNLNFEHKLSDNYSGGIAAGFMAGRDISFDAGALNGAGEELQYSGEMSTSGVFVSPYVRKYFKGAMTGFYLELFAKYYNYKFAIPYEYNKNSSVVMTEAAGNISALGGGFSIGTQIGLGNILVLDIYGSLGLGYGTARAETNDTQLDAQDYADIREEMRKASDVEFTYGNFAISKLNYGATDDMAWAELKSVMPMLRLGIALGFPF